MLTDQLPPLLELRRVVEEVGMMEGGEAEGSSFLTPLLFWFLFGVGSLFRLNFDWLLLILTALTLTGANVAGYVRCKQDARSKIMGGLTSLAARTGMSTAAGNMMQSAAGTAFGFK